MFKLLDGPATPVAGSYRGIAARFRRLIVAAALAAGLAACQSVGPSRGAIEKAAAAQAVPGLQVIDVTDEVAARLDAPGGANRDVFADTFGGAEPVGSVVGVGDTVEVTIFEAAPAALFGTHALDTSIGSMPEGSRPTSLPGFLVGPSGTISVPFAGEVPAAGRTVHQIEQDIVRRLKGRAHLPQVVVRIARNVTATATVLGDVKQPMQVPLTPHGERVLDAVSAAGGTSEPLDRMTIQLTRGSTVRRIAADDIIARPRNNVVLKSGDVVTAMYQPYSFTVLGAAGKNDEVRFESTGLTLSQALGRVGGLQGDRADPKGVFIFRWERPDIVPGAAADELSNGAAGVPVIYRVDLKRPETYLAAQKFEMHNGDVLYVSNSPVSDFQRFVGLVASSILPITTARTVVP